MLELKVGDVIRATSWTHQEDCKQTQLKLNYTAPKGNVVCMLILGNEPKFTSNNALNTLEVMDRMGWQLKDPAQRKAMEAELKALRSKK